MALMQTLRIDRDATRQILWFSGTLADGHNFAVGFPLAHVVVTFDNQTSSMGWANLPVCAGPVSIDGFFDGIKSMTAYKGPAANVARTAQSNMLQSLGKQAQHYATSAVKALRGPTTRAPSHAAPAIGAQGLAAYHAAHLATVRMKAGQDVRQIQNSIRAMIANPHPAAQLALAGLQSYVPR